MIIRTFYYGFFAVFHQKSEKSANGVIRGAVGVSCPSWWTNFSKKKVIKLPFFGKKWDFPRPPNLTDFFFSFYPPLEAVLDTPLKTAKKLNPGYSAIPLITLICVNPSESVTTQFQCTNKSEQLDIQDSISIRISISVISHTNQQSIPIQWVTEVTCWSASTRIVVNCRLSKSN